MCANCGCQGDKTTMLDLQTGATIGVHHASDHDHDRHHHGHQHHHHHGHHADAGHDYTHDHEHGSTVNIVDVETRILAKNDTLAAKNRAWFAGREILALNLISSPGAGKTTLLERTIRDCTGELPIYVIEGDQATAHDGERIRNAGAAAVQINTDTGCHLDAEMVSRALPALKPVLGAAVLIENVGNLVCPALFDLGERAKAVIFPVTDGEDKPVKYPHIFRAARIVLISKIDLLPHVDFAIADAVANIKQVNVDAPILQVSARSGEGMRDWYDWLRAERAAARQAAFA
jgi:hydrogenase nickel incorporation protein HypB